MEPGFSIRLAEERDVNTILGFIQDLAEYEHLRDQVVATPALLQEWLFDKRAAQVLLAEEGQEAVGFALFFHNFSTFLGRAGIYLEDLYVIPPRRGRGYGRALLGQLARLAQEEGCGRLEWWCLDWNKPSIDFYRSIGAQPMDEWTVYRVSGAALERLAGPALSGEGR